MKKENTISNGELKSYLKALLGADIEPFLNAEAEPKSIRFNTLHESLQHILEKLQSRGVVLKKLGFTDSGFSIQESPFSLSHSLDFFKGDFSFQGASSQIPPLVLNPRPGEKVLDMAAAPGSKSTQMGVMMESRGHLVVNDSNVNRMQALNSNMQKAGIHNHTLYYQPGERLGRILPQYFDKVLLDTPCTGLGTIPSHKEILGWWSFEKLRKLNSIQFPLLVSAIKATRVGGEIVYSTCSVAPEENELIIDRALRKYPLEILPISCKGLDVFDCGWTHYKGQALSEALKETKRVWPHKHGMEGFFIARLKKTDDFYSEKYPVKVELLKTKNYSDSTVEPVLQDISNNWGIPFDSWAKYRYHTTKDRIYLFDAGVKQIVKEGFTNGGLLLAEKRLHIWKLTHASVRHFKQLISRNIVTRNNAQLKDLFAEGRCDATGVAYGYYALKVDGALAAIVYVQDEEMRIKMPHAFQLK